MLEIDRAREALHAIPPGLPRADWIRTGMAAKAAGLSLEDFDGWSADGENYNARDCRDAWRSFKNGGIGPGTLYHLAAQHGWRERRIEPLEHKPRHGLDPAAVWGRCEPATYRHGYIERKGAAGVPLGLLRVVPAGDPLRIAGESVAGWLVVPAHGPEGELQSLQFIPPGPGKKLNLPGASMAGCTHIVGTPEPGRPLYLVEGIGQAWACWQATGDAAACCFGWGNVGRVAAAVRQKDKAQPLVLVPDRGKEADAERIAQEYGCKVAKLPEGLPQNFDVNDYKLREDGEALAALLAAASEPPAPELLLRPVDVAGVIADPSPPPRFVWAGYCPRNEVTLLGAHGGTGKSTVALMLAVAVATGRELFGHATEPGRVVFASLEDGADVVRHRLRHICEQSSIEPTGLAAGLAIVDGTTNPELFVAERRQHGATTASYDELCTLAQGAALVIVDNASDAYAGDEIQRQQVRSFIRTLAEIARANDAAVLLLAHVDKGTSRARKAEGGEAYSGSTAWHNSVRSRLFMTRNEDGALELLHQKSNHGPLCEPLRLLWREGGLPELDAGMSPVVAGIADKNDTRALLRLIHEFTTRGEYVSPATTAHTNAARLLSGEPTYPKRKSREIFALLREAERNALIERATYRDAHRKSRDCWQLTASGRELVGLPAPSAPSAPSGDEDAEGARGAPSAPSAPGGYGGRARALSGAKDHFLTAHDGHFLEQQA